MVLWCTCSRFVISSTLGPSCARAEVQQNSKRINNVTQIKGAFFLVICSAVKSGLLDFSKSLEN